MFDVGLMGIFVFGVGVVFLEGFWFIVNLGMLIDEICGLIFIYIVG